MAGRISYLGGIVREGLVLDLDAAKLDSYPKFGTTWRDITFNQNNGTLVNGPTFNSLNGGSIVFDGTNDYTNITNIPFGTNPFSINVWFKMDGLQSINNALVSVNAAGNTNNWQLSFINSNELRFFYKGSGGTDAFSLSYTFISNVWTNVCITKDSNNDIRSYVNATQTATVNYAGNYDHTEIIRLGINRSNAAFFDGNISVVHLYSNKGLTAAEVLQNYNAIKGRYL
jgi:hypothetical protein